MRFYINNVTIYATTGKTRRGALLQSIAQQFEHCILGDVAALNKLVERLTVAVLFANQGSRGKLLEVKHHRGLGPDGGQICVEPSDGLDRGCVFTLSYKPIAQTLFASNVASMISGDLSFNNLRQLAAAGKGGEA